MKNTFKHFVAFLSEKDRNIWTILGVDFENKEHFITTMDYEEFTQKIRWNSYTWQGLTVFTR